MKAFNSIILIAFLAIISFPKSTIAQDLTKSELLNAMNNVGDLGLSSDEESALKEANNNIVNNMFAIADSNDSPEEKTKRFQKAKEENVKVFEGLLGDTNFKKYKKKMKKELKPFKRKAKLVGFLL